MLRLDDDRDPERMQRLLDAVADLYGQALLDLEPAGVGLHDASDLAQSGNLSVRNVCHMSLADEGAHMVFAHRVQLDILDDDHLLVLLVKNGLLDDLGAILLIALGHELQRFRHSLGGLHEPLAHGVLSDEAEDLLDVGRNLRSHFFIVNLFFCIWHRICSIFFYLCGKFPHSKFRKNNNNLTITEYMYWTLEFAGSLDDAPWPATKDELIDYANRSGAPEEVIENLSELEDDGEIYESIEDIWPDYPTKEDFFFNEEEY